MQHALMLARKMLAGQPGQKQIIMITDGEPTAHILPGGGTFFDYPPEIRRIIYTTNAIESVNMSLRKITKDRGSFPSDDALLKLFYLALANISKKWTMPLRDWKAALTRFTIQFEERMPKT